jgi:post-segregation antitoxin (ccd killing protein)
MGEAEEMATKESRVRESGARKQFTVTVSAELGRYLEERAAETGLNKSAVVSQALEVDRRRRKEFLMREGYEEMAEQHLELVREFEHMVESTGWPDY